ncbi:MAG: hypothetical protein AB7L17_04455 [Ilumatobacteraceae bacterium]
MSAADGFDVGHRVDAADLGERQGLDDRLRFGDQSHAVVVLFVLVHLAPFVFLDVGSSLAHVAASDGLDDIYGPAIPITQHPKVRVQPLLDFLAEAGDDASLRTVARRLGIDPAVLCRPLSLGQADTFATKLGYHPGEVWGAAYWRPRAA